MYGVQILADVRKLLCGKSRWSRRSDAGSGSACYCGDRRAGHLNVVTLIAVPTVYLPLERRSPGNA
jgi:hypothetical protein